MQEYRNTIGVLMLVTVACVCALAANQGATAPDHQHSINARPGAWPRADLTTLRADLQLMWSQRVNLLLDDDIYASLGVLGEEKKWQALAVGLPIEPNLRLVLMSDSGESVIGWPSDLKGQVVITSTENALDFVRLFSSEATWYRFPQYGYVEIQSSEGLVAPGIAKVAAQTFEDLGLPRAYVAKHRENGYIVIRAVAEPLRDQKNVIVRIVCERIGSDGEYWIESLWKRTVSAESLGLKLPEFK